MAVPTLPSLQYVDVDGEHSFALRGDSATIGRSPDQNLVLKEAFVSRRHALIMRQNSHFELVDQNSSHGTYLNGERVERAKLKSGDTIQFGSVNAGCFRFVLPESESMSGVRASELLSALSVFAPTDRSVPKPARELEKLSFLLNAARQLNSSGAITDVLHALLQLSLELTGTERGFVFLLENGELRHALGLRADGTSVGEDSSVSRRAMQKAVESNSKFSLSDTLADVSAAAWQSVMANSIRSIYCIPLRKHISPTEPNRLLGMLYLDSQIGNRSLSDIDHQVLDTLASEASTLLHNALLADTEQKARQAEEQLAIAASIHSGLMAVTLPRLDFAEVCARSLPCHAIGGDFYDVIVLDNSLCVAIADVSGKGVPASIVAATLQGIIHALMLTGESLPKTADLINRFLCARQVGKYATMVLLKVFPNGLVEYMNCGHVPPLLVSSKGTTIYLEEANLIVGIVQDAEYVSSQFTLHPGDRILLTTDGITETKDGSGQMIGMEGLEDLAPTRSLDEIVGHLQKVQAGGEAQDDWTLLDIRFTGK
ncbi:MAG TPA: SpoIIE family protein phosphatase [Terracidiphilus sp.]|jgi:serine phosphatase RsbU (regulator of sigma subunit)